MRPDRRQWQRMPGIEKKMDLVEEDLPQKKTNIEETSKWNRMN